MSGAHARLAYGLRGLAGKRQALCRCCRVAPHVALVEREHRGTGERRLVTRGVLTCGSVWSCPMCAARIMTERAAEISQAVETHGRHRVTMVTATIRHASGDSLALLNSVLATAWGAMFAGRAGGALAARLGLAGYVRAAEQTWGRENGWHPHLHALLFTNWIPPIDAQVALGDRWEAMVRNTIARAVTLACGRLRGRKSGEPTDVRFRSGRIATLTAQQCEERLVKIVGTRAMRELEPEALALQLARLEPAPNEHGVRLSKVTDGRYLAKLGLEVASIATKTATSDAHLTSWGIAQQAAAGDKRARALWAEHAQAMRGKRQLTWSRDIRDRLALGDERSDDAVAADGSPLRDEDERLLGRIGGDEWDARARPLRQLWTAHVAEAYAAGQLGQLAGFEAATTEHVSMWREQHVRARDPAHPGTIARRAARTARELARAGPRLSVDLAGSMAERELRVEELRHKLADLGLQG